MIQFIVRAAVGFLLTVTDKDLNKSFISMKDPESWKDLGEMYTLGWNTILLRVMAWWAFDVFTQIATFLPTEYLAGQTILRNIGLFTFMIPAGLSGAANILIGKQIGKNSVAMALRMNSIIRATVFTLSVLQIIGVLIYEDAIINFYTHDKKVQDTIHPAWVVLGVFIFFDCMQSNGTGTINALGKLSEIKWTSTINYWFVGIPVACFFMFYMEMFLQGLWIGPTVAVFLNWLYYSYKVRTYDWQQVCDAHQEKMRLKGKASEATEEKD